MLSFARDLLRVKLQLGYLLFWITVAAIFFSAHRFIAPGTVLHPRTAVTTGSQKHHAAAAGAPNTAWSSTSLPDAHKPLSISAPQLASIQRYIDASSRICSSQVTSAIGTDPKLGIESDIAQWYLDSHKQTQDEAKSSGHAVAMESGGNGWVYTDADVLGMVAPLKFAMDDSVIDVGCGDGYFLSRILHFYSRHRLAVVGVDIMDFYVYTARARFVSISADLQSNHEGAMTYGSSKPNALFPAACLGSGLDLRWIPNETFNKYIALSPINHFDDAGGEKMVCEAFRVLKRGGIAWFGMVNRETGTYVVKHVKPEAWWKGVAKRCGFSRYYTTREWSEWRMAAQPTPRYHAYLYKD